jgi:hypothetical protein
MPVYRVLRFRGSLLSEVSDLDATDNIAATIAANALSKSERVELWLGDKQVAVLRPSRGRTIAALEA